MSNRIGAWVRQAACRGMPTRWWFPDRDDEEDDGELIDRAKAVCAECPVLGSCRRWAMAHPEEIGVWGGLTEAERRVTRRQKGAA